jgi:hypothetical protein
MYGIFGKKISPERMRVETIQRDIDESYRVWKAKEGEENANRRRAKFVEVEYLPEPEEQAGKHSVLYYNPQTAELWYDYPDRVDQPADSAALNAKIDALTATVNALTAKVDKLK